MPSTSRTAHERLIEFYLEDATDRLRFQQEFSIQGFKTLILINGGAVIALLTYAGNSKGSLSAPIFQWAFAGYIGGLTSAVLAYLTAYLGQAYIMRHSAAAALAEMEALELDPAMQTRREARANLFIGLGVGLCMLSLIGFIGGSVAAMLGLA